jgi:hypothetical protein
VSHVSESPSHTYPPYLGSGANPNGPSSTPKQGQGASSVSTPKGLALPRPGRALTFVGNQGGSQNNSQPLSQNQNSQPLTQLLEDEPLYVPSSSQQPALHPSTPTVVPVRSAQRELHPLEVAEMQENARWRASTSQAMEDMSNKLALYSEQLHAAANTQAAAVGDVSTALLARLKELETTVTTCRDVLVVVAAKQAESERQFVDLVKSAANAAAASALASLPPPQAPPPPPPGKRAPTISLISHLHTKRVPPPTN